MKKTNVIILIFILVIIVSAIFFIFFDAKESKNSKMGNNISSQEIVDYILNINSYEATIELEVDSNKNKNKYLIKQNYMEPELSSQEIIEPDNIAGIKITRENKKLKIENTNLNLSTIFENYEYVSDNSIDLSTFIKEYGQCEDTRIEEENDTVIMILTNNEKEKQLYIDKNTKKPVKLQIRDINQNTMIYILYRDINIK